MVHVLNKSYVKQGVISGEVICKIIANNSNNSLLKIISEYTFEDWCKILFFAQKYNMEPLLYSKLQQKGYFIYLPVEIKSHLVRKYNASSMSSLKCDYEITRLLLELNNADIDVILLKGIYARKCIYNNPAERMMCDIDILVQESDLESSLNILRDFGCKVNESYNIENLKKFSQHIPVIITPKGFNIELHWTFFPPDSLVKPLINVQELWEEKEQIFTEDVNFYSLNKEQMIVYLCLNIAENRFKQKLLQIYDIYLVLQKEKINWDNILNIAENWSSQKAVYSVFIALQELFDVDTDNEFLAKLEESIEDRIDIREAIVSTALGELKDEKQVRVVDRLESKSLSEKAKFIFWTSLSREKIIFHYGLDNNAKKISLYRVKRFFSLSKKFSSNIFELYFKNPAKRKEIKQAHQDGLKKIENWLKP